MNTFLFLTKLGELVETLWCMDNVAFDFDQKGGENPVKALVVLG